MTRMSKIGNLFHIVQIVLWFILFSLATSQDCNSPTIFCVGPSMEFQNLQLAVNSVSTPGDKIYIKGGTYDINLIISNQNHPSGSSEYPIEILPFPSETVILNNEFVFSIIKVTGVKHWKIHKGFGDLQFVHTSDSIFTYKSIYYLEIIDATVTIGPCKMKCEVVDGVMTMITVQGQSYGTQIDGVEFSSTSSSPNSKCFQTAIEIDMGDIDITNEVVTADKMVKISRSVFKGSSYYGVDVKKHLFVQLENNYFSPTLFLVMLRFDALKKLVFENNIFDFDSKVSQGISMFTYSSLTTDLLFQNNLFYFYFDVFDFFNNNHLYSLTEILKSVGAEVSGNKRVFQNNLFKGKFNGFVIINEESPSLACDTCILRNNLMESAITGGYLQYKNGWTLLENEGVTYIALESDQPKPFPYYKPVGQLRGKKFPESPTKDFLLQERSLFGITMGPFEFIESTCSQQFFDPAKDCHICLPKYYETNEHTCVLCENGFSCTDGIMSPCPVGHYCLNGNVIECGLGKYQDLEGQIQCKDCEKGKYQDIEGEVECKLCQKGYYQDELGQSYCKKCSVGNYQDLEGQIECKDCEKGKYQDYEGQEECKLCNKGLYQDELGRTYCKICAYGEYSDEEGLEECKRCEPGTFNNKKGPNVECFLCGYGLYQDQEGARNCNKCGGGEHQDELGQPRCKDCAVGYYTNLVEQKYCKKCSVGNYQDFEGQLSCKGCEVGHFQDEMGQNSCKECDAGTYQDEIGQSECKPCLSNDFCPVGSTEITPCDCVTKYSNGCTNSVNDCQCVDGASGARCQNFTCFGKHPDSIDACSGPARGKCVGPNTCNCVSEYYMGGSECEFDYCNGIPSNESSFVCSGHGTCLTDNICECFVDESLNQGYFGKFCNEFIHLNARFVVIDENNITILINYTADDYMLSLKGKKRNEKFFCPRTMGGLIFSTHINDFGNQIFLDKLCYFNDNNQLIINILDTIGKIQLGYQVEICSLSKMSEEIYITLSEEVGREYLPGGGGGDGTIQNNLNPGEPFGPSLFEFLVGMFSVFVVCLVIIILIICILKKRCKVKKIKTTLDKVGNQINETINSQSFKDLKKKIEKYLFTPPNGGKKKKKKETIEIEMTEFKIERDDYKISEGDVKLISQISTGAQATIFSGEYHFTKVAVKSFILPLNPEGLTQEDMKEFEAELNFVCKLRHDNIVNLRGYVLSKRKMWIIMELCDQDLETWILHHKELEIENETKTSMVSKLSILLDIAKGMNFIHKKRIIHRDLKPKNVLLKNKRAIIADFGLSSGKFIKNMKSKDKSQDNETTKCKDLIGSLGYIAPECLLKQRYSEKSDVFAFAIICLNVLMLKVNVYSENSEIETEMDPKINKKIFNGYRPPIPEDSNEVPESLRRYIKILWIENYELRPNFEEICKKFHQQIQIYQKEENLINNDLQLEVNDDDFLESFDLPVFDIDEEEEEEEVNISVFERNKRRDTRELDLEELKILVLDDTEELDLSTDFV